MSLECSNNPLPASNVECNISAIPPSEPEEYQPIIIASMIIEGCYICNFEIDTDASNIVQ